MSWNLSNKYRKQLLDTASKIGLDALKMQSEKVTHKEVEETGQLKGNKIPDKIVKPKPVLDEIQEMLKKQSRNIKQIKTSIIKWNTMKCLNY